MPLVLEQQVKEIKKPPPELCCEECGIASFEYECVQCDEMFCRECFNAVHKNRKALKKHTFIDLSFDFKKTTKFCPIHNKPIDQFCLTCKIDLCISCKFSQHDAHNTVKIAEQQVRFNFVRCFLKFTIYFCCAILVIKRHANCCAIAESNKRNSAKYSCCKRGEFCFLCLFKFFFLYI